MKGISDMRVEFPCGYRYHHIIRVSQGLFDFVKFHADNSDMPVCPLHGKECKKGGKPR